MTVLNNVRGVLRGGMIELRDAIGLPEGSEVNLTIEAAGRPPTTGQLDPRLEALIGAFADIGDEVDEFNRWYREARHNDVPREISPE